MEYTAFVFGLAAWIYIFVDLKPKLDEMSTEIKKLKQEIKKLIANDEK